MSARDHVGYDDIVADPTETLQALCMRVNALRIKLGWSWDQLGENVGARAWVHTPQLTIPDLIRYSDFADSAARSIRDE